MQFTLNQTTQKKVNVSKKIKIKIKSNLRYGLKSPNTQIGTKQFSRKHWPEKRIQENRNIRSNEYRTDCLALVHRTFQLEVANHKLCQYTVLVSN